MADKAKLLIIRFSSFGDIVQAVSVPYHFQQAFPKSEVHWLVREDFAQLLLPQPTIKQVISFSRKQGLLGLIGQAWKLAGDGYTHVYDAHNNVRSHIVVAIFFLKSILSLFSPRPRNFWFLRRPKNRIKRFYLFVLRINKFEKPFIAAKSFLDPLKKWGIKFNSRDLLGKSRFIIPEEARIKVREILGELELEPLKLYRSRALSRLENEALANELLAKTHRSHSSRKIHYPRRSRRYFLQANRGRRSRARLQSRRRNLLSMKAAQ